MQLLEEFKEQIDTFIEVNDKTIHDAFAYAGHYIPMATFFCVGQDGFTIAPTPIPQEFFETGASKNLVAKSLIPHIIETLNSSGMTVLCMCFAHEAWMQSVEMPKDDFTMKEAQELAKNVPKVECLVSIYETPLTSISKHYEIVRTGIASGEKPILKPLKQYDSPLGAESGRFQNILRRQPSFN